MENGKTKKIIFSAITPVVAFLFSANFAFAAEMKISAQEVEKIKTVLGIVNTASNFGSVLVDGGGLMKILNTAIEGGQTATDVTYGLLVLSAINEMEFIDMVLSQDYKDKARDYFNQILDERVNLRSYWKGVGFDIPRVVGGKIASPMAALTLNSFEMTDKVISILGAFNNVKTELKYDGLWYYFDFRRGGDSHEEAWEMAEAQMGWAAKSVSFRRNIDRTKERNELEQQFASLYEKWGPYATPFGISKGYKEQLASELRTTLALTIEENTEVSPMYAQERSVWDKLAVQLASIKDAIVNIASQSNPFKAGPIVELPSTAPQAEVPAENGSPQTEEAADVGFPPISGPESEPEPAEMMDIGYPSNEEISTTTEKIEKKAEEEIMEVEPPLIDVGRPLCQRENGGTARQYRVLINEVAWMGDQDSPNNEWIELKNVWGIPVNLAGWQIQDKNQQIKVIFEEGDAIPAGGYYLLERSKDYTGALGNTDEALYLFDDNCQLEDEILANPDWPGGDNVSKKTLQRFDVLTWYTGAITAGIENGTPPANLVHPSAPATTPASAPKINYLKLLITESRTASPGNEKDDFVELYNPNSETVSLSNWYMQRKTAGGQDFSSYAPASLFSGKTIGSKSYFLVANASSSLSAELVDASTDYPLTDNNTLFLKNPDQEIVDQVSTGNSPPNKSYGRQWSSTTLNHADTFENQAPTPKAQNESSAGASASVVINEIAWAGTKANSADEWMEFFNSANSAVDLAGWKMKKDGQDWINFSTSTVISAQGFYLLERTADDNSVSDIPADYFFTGSLNNGGEKLELIDANGNAIDTVDASTTGWFAGAASPSYISMEKINATSSAWAGNNRIAKNGLDAAGNPINGTPKAQNSVSKPFTNISNNFTATEDLTMTFLGSPYLVEGSMAVSGAKLTIESGVTVKFKHVGAPNQNALLKVENGVLEAVGTADKKIIFTSSSTQPQAGDWDGLYLENSTSTLNNVIAQYGGLWHTPPSGEFTPYTYGAVYIDGGNAQINNTLIEKNGTFGLWLKNSTSTQIINSEFKENPGTADRQTAVYIENSNPAIKNSIFRNNTIGILAENYSAPTIKDNQFIENTAPIQITSLLTDIGDNTFQNNGDNGVLVRSFGFSDSAQEINWQKINAPYFVDAALIVPSGYMLKIKPGVEIRLKNNGQINADGNLQANGTSQNKIVFTGASEVPGAWKYIKFSSSSTDSTLEQVVVKYGGFFDLWGGSRYGAVKIEGLNFVIKDSVFENNRLAVELINGNFASQSSDVVIRKNEVGIYVTAGGPPNLSDITFGAGEDANTYNILP